MNPITHIHIQAELDFQTLCSKLTKIVIRMSYLPTDRRGLALQSLMQICMWMLMEIKHIQPYASGNTSQLTMMFGLKNLDAVKFVNSMDIFLRASFLTVFMFETENLLKMIRNNLSNTSTSNGYYDISKDVLQITHPSNLQQKHDILQVPAYTRNCLHSSGVHTKSTKSFTIDTENFDFIQDQMFNKAGWNHIFFMINKLIDVLEEILINNEVKQLRIP
jgi:hypothetical protein